MRQALNLCVANALLVLSAFGATPAMAQRSNVPVIAVGEIESTYSRFDMASIRSALETALTKTRKYKIMERRRLDTLLAERGLSAAGIADGNASLSGFSGVDYMMYGRVSEATVTGQSVILMRQCQGAIALDIRTVDLHTGEIRFAEIIRIEKVVNTTGTEQDPCAGVSASNLQPLISSAAEVVVEKLSIAIFPIKVARVANGNVYLNYGEPVLLQGDYLEVVKLGEGFVDPDTGEILGSDEENMGYLLIHEVRPKFSIASIVQQNSQISVGDIVHKLDKNEMRAVRKMLSDIEKARKAKARACKNAEKRVDKRCGKDPNSSKCLNATAEADRACA